MKIKLYKPFEHWNNFDNIWVYSDPHFGDEEMAEFRGNVVSDKEQIKRINQKVGKKGMIIFLGDIGDIEYIKKIKGYKVLVMGNHDVGASKYKRVRFSQMLSADENNYKILNIFFPGYDINCTWRGLNKAIGDAECYTLDNHLFDEVYDGPLMINDKIMLSHEPVDLPFIFNIHGHVHDKSKMKLKLNLLNVCAEHIDYTPVSLKNVAKSGLVGDVHNIHRTTIDNATDRKIKRNKENI